MIREAYSIAQPPLRAWSTPVTNACMYDSFWSLITYEVYSRSWGGGSGSGNLTYVIVLARLLKRAHNCEVILTRIIRHLILGIRVVATLLVFFRS